MHAIAKSENDEFTDPEGDRPPTLKNRVSWHTGPVPFKITKLPAAFDVGPSAAR